MDASLAIETIQPALRDWVEYAVRNTEAKGRTAFARQRMPKLEGPYVTIDVESIQQVGQDERRSVDDDGMRTVRGPRVVQTTIVAYGSGALNLAEVVRSALWLNDVQTRLRRAGLARQTIGAVQNLTTALETTFEERGMFEARFVYTAEQTESVSFIDRVQGEGELWDDPDTSPLEGSPVVEWTFDLSPA